MPFDGTGFRNREADILDAILAFFAGGRNWTQGQFKNGERRCLVQALRDTRKKLHIRGDRTGVYIRKAIAEACDGNRVPTIEGFNDNYCWEFTDIQWVLLRAKEIATDAPPFALRPHHHLGGMPRQYSLPLPPVPFNVAVDVAVEQMMFRLPPLTA